MTIYMDDRYFFRYRHIQSIHINPQAPVFDINREPVLAPIMHPTCMHTPVDGWGVVTNDWYINHK